MIETIAIIGAGQMGAGIAHVCALSKLHIILTDVSGARLEHGIKLINESLDRQVSRGKVSASEKENALTRIQTTVALNSLGKVDLVIEAVSENEELKRDIYKELANILGENTLIATNTSSISITRLAAASDRPGQFMGMHFMNPVPAMQLVELIRGIATEPETFEQIRALTEKLGKTPVSSEDFPAFIVNRILLPMINEAVYTLYEGVGSVDSIDTAMRLGANHPMGPLQLADFIGLDVCLAVMQVLHEGLADSKYRPCPLLVKYVEAGWLGHKSKRGFYDYSGDVPLPTR